MSFRKLAALTAVFLLMASTAWAQPSAPVTLAKGKRPSLATDNRGNLHVVYQGWVEGSPAPDILYCRSNDGGRTWSAPKNVSNTPGVSSDPAIASDSGGILYAVWCDTSSGDKRPDIYFSRSKDGGATWSAAKDISNTPGVSSQPALAIDPLHGYIHVVWCDTSEGEKNPDVWHAESTDGGDTWKDPSNISHTPGISSDPQVAAASDEAVAVVWADTSTGSQSPDIYYQRHSHGGWRAVSVDISNTPGKSANPDIACGPDGDVYVTWSDTSNGPPDIYFGVANRGEAFSKPRNISNTPGISSDPSISADGQGHLVVVWSDSSKGAPDIWAAHSMDRGQSFSNPTNLSQTPGVSKLPDVVLVHDTIYVVWEEVEGGHSSIKMVSAPLVSPEPKPKQKKLPAGKH